MRHDVAETVELTYTTRPPMPGDIAFIHRMSEIVKEEAFVRARKSPLAPFDFDIEGLIKVDVRPAEGEGLLIDVARTRLNVRPSANGNGKEPRQELFSARIQYPDSLYEGRLDSLVGVADIVTGVKTALLTLTTDAPERWARRFHPSMVQAIMRRRAESYPAILLTGDPGLGKTEVAMSAGDWLARATGKPVYALKLDLRVRGGGHVGDLSKHVSEAWDEVEARHTATGATVILVVDEADAVAQSRAQGQQHHEDQVGVNTFIQRMDGIRGRNIIAFFLTNLEDSIDPAARRRMHRQYHFRRPDLEARRQLLASLFGNALPVRTLDEVGRRTEGYTPADLYRVFTNAMDVAVSGNEPLSDKGLIAALEAVRPTASLEDESRRAGKHR